MEMKAIPNEAEYDVLQAKLCASLLWFVCRLSENGFQNIPQEVTSPIEASTKSELSLRPAVIDYLSRGTMYLYIGSILYKQEFHNLWDLIQKLSHNGVFVMCEGDEAVTDQDLIMKNPFNLSAHLALMDSLQIVYGNSIVTVPDVLNVIRSLGTFNAAKEMPFDVEDSLILWLSKVNEINFAEYKKENHSHEVFGTSRALMPDESFPVVRNICDSFRDTRSMLSLLMFYLPDSLKIESMKLGNSLSPIEKISNIELFRCVCAEQVCTSVFALRMEDMLFAKEPLKTNFLVLLCEMFYKMEVERKDSRILYYPSSGHLELPQTERYDSPSTAQPRQLLSKRSKKVFAALNSEPENSDLVLDDLEVKGCHAVPSTINQHEFVSVSHAWQGDSPTLEASKPEKINLNFRHDYGSFNRVMTTSCSDVQKSNYCDVTDSECSSKSGMDMFLTSEDLNTSEKFNENTSDDFQFRSEYVSSYQSCPTFTVSDNQSFIGSSVSRSCDEVYSIENDCVTNKCSPQTIVQAPVHDKKQNTSTFITEPCNRVDDDVEEDALSTITEITEPDPVSVYSLHSSLSSVATKASTEEIDDDRKILESVLKTTNSESKIEDIGTPLWSNETRNPPDNVLLATISRTFKDPNSAANSAMSDKSKSQGQEFHTVSDVNNFNHSSTCPVHISSSSHQFCNCPRIGNDSLLDIQESNITDNIKKSCNEHTSQRNSDLRSDGNAAWYLTQSEIPSSNTNENETSNPKKHGGTSDFITNDLSPERCSKQINDSEKTNNTRESSTMFDVSNPPISISTNQSICSYDDMDIKDKNSNSIFGSGNDMMDVALVADAMRKEMDEMRRTKSNSKDAIDLSNCQECYSDLLDIQENKVKVNVMEPLTNMNGLSDLNTLWSTTEKMIIKSMVKTSDNNMTFSKQFVSGDLLLKHLTSLSNEYNKDDDSDNNNNDSNKRNKNEATDNRRNFNGIEKICFSTNKMSSNGKVIEDDYTTWMDLFDRSNTGHNKIKIDNEMIKRNQEKLKRYKSSQTTWADIPQTTFNGEVENEDETLSIQLAALRMQLEEKRRRFDEEKKRKQEQWREERAKNLQNAFFVMLNNNEQDPAELLLGNMELDSNQLTSNTSKHIGQDSCEPKVDIDGNEWKTNHTQQTEEKTETETMKGVENFRESEDIHANEAVGISYTVSDGTVPSISLHTTDITNGVDIDRIPFEVDDDQPLSKLIKEFSPFSNDDVQSNIVSCSTLPSNVTGEYGKSDTLHYSDGTFHDPCTPGISSLLDELGSTPQELMSAQSDSNFDFGIKQNTLIENFDQMKSFGSDNILTLPKNEPPDIGHSVIRKDLELKSYLEQEIVPNTTIDSVLAQVGSSPYTSLNHADITVPEEEPMIIANKDSHFPDVLQTGEEPDFVQGLPIDMQKVEDIVPKDERPINVENVLSEVLRSEQSPADLLPTPDIHENVTVPNQDVIPEKVSDVLSQENVAKTPSATTFVVGIDMMGTPELTPQQIKKRERFLRQRQKNIEEEKEKKAAELEKKMRMEESTPKKTAKEEHPKDGNLGQDVLNKRLGNDQISHESPSRKPKREPAAPRMPRTPQHSAATPTSSNSNQSDEASRYTEYTGPDAYKKPSGKSNRKIIQNAIMHCCLCGEVNKESKKKCLDALEKSDANHFLVLFREGLKFRSVYEYHPENELVVRVYGIGPKNLTEKMVTKYYKYNSGGKEFYSLETKHLSIQVDGLMIKKELWEKKQSNSSKTDSNLKKFLSGQQK